MRSIHTGREPAVPGRVERLLIRADGAARGNPGPASAGAVLIDLDQPSPYDTDAPPVAVVARPLGIRTNNWAEWTAVVLALERARSLGASEVELVLDSKLVVEQLMGRWRVKEPSLVPLHARATRMLPGFRAWTVRHEARASNRAADALANLALDDPLRAEALERAVTTGPRADGPTDDALAVVGAWFDAWAAADLDRARALLAPDAILHLPEGSDIQGFEALLEWFAARRAGSGASFGYQVVSMLGGDELAAALLRLHDVRDGLRLEWEQVAVYRVAAGRVAEVWAMESDAVERPFQIG